MPLLTIDSHWQTGAVRVRATATDDFAGKSGHDYIAARNLNAPVQRLDPNAADREQAVRNIIAATKPKAASVPADRSRFVFTSGHMDFLGDKADRRFWVVRNP